MKYENLYEAKAYQSGQWGVGFSINNLDKFHIYQFNLEYTPLVKHTFANGWDTITTFTPPTLPSFIFTYTSQPINIDTTIQYLQYKGQYPEDTTTVNNFGYVTFKKTLPTNSLDLYLIV